MSVNAYEGDSNPSSHEPETYPGIKVRSLHHCISVTMCDSSTFACKNVNLFDATALFSTDIQWYSALGGKNIFAPPSTKTAEFEVRKRRINRTFAIITFLFYSKHFSAANALKKVTVIGDESNTRGLEGATPRRRRPTGVWGLSSVLIFPVQKNK